MNPKIDPEANPWKTVSSKIAYKNPWISVREDQVIRPDGSPGIYGVVETRVATGVVALTEDLSVWLVGQYRYPLQEYSWEIIEGGSDPGENPLDTAKRELQEESGLRASRWIQLGKEYHLSNCFSSEIGVIFLATGLSQTTAAPEVTEVLQLREAPFREVLRMVERGDIKDSLTIVGIVRAEKYLRAKGVHV